jgi:hypothetical protein
VEGNLVGTDATEALTGTLSVANGGGGIWVDSSSNNVIGGTTPGSRNVVSGNASGTTFDGYAAAGIVLNEGPFNTVQGNYVGTDVTGEHALPNQGAGIFLNAPNTIGGVEAGAGNLISGNSGAGVLAMSGGSITGNVIGTDASGTRAIGNTTNGVFLLDGATATVSHNRIANSGSAGIHVGASSTDSETHVDISQNSLFNNRDLGIDLAPQTSWTVRAPLPGRMTIRPVL